MRVLWTHNFDPARPNAGCFMHTAAQGLAELGVDVRLEYLGNLRHPSTILAARRRVRGLAKDVDVVHAQYGSACAWATAGSDAPAVISIRGNDWNLHSETLHPLWLHTRLARAMTRLALRRFDAVTAVSRRISAEVSRFVRPGTRVTVLPSAIDLSRWPVPNLASPAGRRRHRVLFTANNPSDPIKRVGLLDRAVAIAAGQVGPIEVVRATGIDHFDMPSLVASCDAVACTSETEGWPNSVKEALACGVPFVATDVSDLRAIADVEPSCRVVAADPASFADGLCAVLRAGRTPGLRRHVEPMDLFASSRRLLDLYEQVAGH